MKSAEVEARREHASQGSGRGALGSGQPAWEEGSCLQGVQSGQRVPVTPPHGQGGVEARRGGSHRNLQSSGRRSVSSSCGVRGAGVGCGFI